MFVILGMLTTILTCPQPIPSFERIEVPGLCPALNAMILILSVACVHRKLHTLSRHGLGHVGVWAVPKPASVLMQKAPNDAPGLSGPGLLSPGSEGNIEGIVLGAGFAVYGRVACCFGACGHSWLVIHDFPEHVLLSFGDLP